MPPSMPIVPAAVQSAPHPAKKKKSPIPLFMGAALLIAAVCVFVFREDVFGSSPGVPGTSKTAAPSGAEITAIGFDAAAASVHNARMSGMYAFAGEKVYHNDGINVVDETGNTVFHEPLYYMGADENALYGVTVRGEIIAIGTDGSERVLRSAKTPSQLTLAGERLYFVEEDGLYTIGLHGGGEQRIVSERPAAFTVSGSAVYYTGADGLLWRTDGAEPIPVLDVVIDSFCLHGEQLYYTLAGSGELLLLNDDGSSGTVSGAMRGLFSPRFAVYSGHLVYGEPGGGVYQQPLNGGEVEVIEADGCVAFYLLPGGIVCEKDIPVKPEYTLTDQR